MNTRLHVLGVVCGLFVAATVTGCANESTARASAPVNGAANAASAPTAEAADAMWIGPTRAESTDPTVLAWQTDLLAAIGREGEFYLFDYVVSAKGQVYVGMSYAPLRLTPAQLAAAEAVNKKYAQTSAGAFEQANLWLATQSDAPAPNQAGQVADSR